MDKEREAFDKWYGEKPKGWLDGVKYNTAWKAWQAAKAQAVPEGQILVNKGDYVELVRTNRERQKTVARLTEEVKILRDRKKYYKNKCKELSVGDDCVVVPKEPSDRAIKFIGGSKQGATIVYKAMLAASQEPNQPTQFNLDKFLTMEEKLKHKGGVITADLDRFIAYAEMVLGKTKTQAVPDTYTPIVLALEDVQSKIEKASFLTMDADNENEVYAVDANEISAYIDELIEAQETK